MKQFTVFNIGEEEFGVDIFKIVEILNPVRVFTIPGMPDFLSGVINLRGMVIPILDLRKRFNVVSRPDRERLLIVWVEGRRVGLHVDSVSGIIEFSENEILSPPPIFKGFKPEYLVGLGKKSERVIFLLHTDNILSAEEKITLRETKEKLESSIVDESEKTS